MFYAITNHILLGDKDTIFFRSTTISYKKLLILNALCKKEVILDLKGLFLINNA